MSIQALLTFLKRHKTLFAFSIVFLGVLLFGTESLFANEGDPLVNDEDFGKIIKILNGFITVAATLMGLVTSFISMFLYPGWVNGTLFGLQDYLKEMWILVSNVVYFIFAFVLIAIAFMNIIGKGEGTWELKQAMPKFIVGVLIVPFSWFIVQFILSVSAILTVGVLTLPYDSFSDHDLFIRALDNTELADQKICKDIVISFTGEFGEGAQQIGGEANDLDENIKCKNEDSKISIKELITGKDEDGNLSVGADGLQNSVFGVISIYSYGILRIHELDSIFQKDLTTIKTLADLVFKIVFDLLFIAVYLLLMIALLLALFVRGVRLWVFMMLSPLFGLLYFFGKTGEGSGYMEKFSPKEFIALALVPVYVSAALAFGLVFILVASEGIKETSSAEDVLEAGGFSLTVIGAHGSGESEKSVIGKLIVEIFGVVILWIAVMSALGASKTTQAVVEPIAAFGKSVGDLAAKAPTYAPIIPSPGGLQSAASLKTVGSSIQSAAAGAQSERAQRFMDNSPLGGGAADSVSRLSNAASLAASNIENFSDRPGKVMEELRDLLRTDGRGSASNIRNSEPAQNAIKAAATSLGMNPEDVSALKFNSERDVMEALATVDRQARIDHGAQVGSILFEGEFGDGQITQSDYSNWLAGQSAGNNEDDIPPSSNSTNNVNVTIGGTSMTPHAAVIQLAKNTKSELEAELDSQGIEGREKTAILNAFDNIDADNNGTIDGGGDD